jgi:hypothetical protein
MPISRVCDLDRSVGLRARGRPSLLSPLPPTMQPKFPMLWFASPIHRLRYESPQTKIKCCVDQLRSPGIAGMDGPVAGPHRSRLTGADIVVSIDTSLPAVNSARNHARAGVICGRSACRTAACRNPRDRRSRLQSIDGRRRRGQHPRRTQISAQMPHRPEDRGASRPHSQDHG